MGKQILNNIFAIFQVNFFVFWLCLLVNQPDGTDLNIPVLAQYFQDV